MAKPKSFGHGWSPRVGSEFSQSSKLTPNPSVNLERLEDQQDDMERCFNCGITMTLCCVLVVGFMMLVGFETVGHHQIKSARTHEETQQVVKELHEKTEEVTKTSETMKELLEEIQDDVNKIEQNVDGKPTVIKNIKHVHNKTIKETIQNNYAVASEAKKTAIVTTSTVVGLASVTAGGCLPGFIDDVGWIFQNTEAEELAYGPTSEGFDWFEFYTVFTGGNLMKFNDDKKRLYLNEKLVDVECVEEALENPQTQSTLFPNHTIDDLDDVIDILEKRDLRADDPGTREAKLDDFFSDGSKPEQIPSSEYDQFYYDGGEGQTYEEKWKIVREGIYEYCYESDQGEAAVDKLQETIGGLEGVDSDEITNMDHEEFIAEWVGETEEFYPEVWGQMFVFLGAMAIILICGIPLSGMACPQKCCCCPNCCLPGNKGQKDAEYPDELD